ncbi:cytochrome P450 [Paraphysoderma sedebokerense]|nr:cytochrome P450 [Paraphysoderma sedebokerense]
MLLISLLLIPVGLVLAVLVTLVGLLIYRHIHARIFCRKYPFPGPNPELFAVDLTEEHLSQESHFQRFGSHFRQFLLGIPIYTVANAEDARHILTVKNLRKSYIVEERLSGVWGRYGLITASHAGDNPWRIYRRLADPSFKVSALKGMQELKRLTFNIISDVIGCGPDVVDSNFLNAFITNIGFVNSPLLLFPLGWAVFKALHRREYDTVINTAEEIIQSRKNKRKNSADREAISDGNSRIDILDLLLSAEDESGRKLSDLEIRDQMVQIFGAGYDT